MRTQMGMAVNDYVSNIPNMSAYELGHDVGFVSEKVLEIALVSRGTSLTVNVVRGSGVAGGNIGANTVKSSNALVRTVTQFSKHSLERLAQRGVTQKMAQTVIRKGRKFYDPLNKSVNYVIPNGFGSGKSLLIATNPLTGQVTTVIRSSKNLIKSRFIPIK
jgi:hypothetical protein